MPEPSDSGPQSIRVRPATVDDLELVLEWANEPATRATGFHPAPIGMVDHARWYTGFLAMPERGRIWIGTLAERPVGVGRVQRDSDASLVVSVSIAVDQRRRGLSGPLLAAVLEAARSAFPGGRFRAWIRPDNAASVALFRSAGFVAPALPPSTLPAGAPADVIVLERA